MQAMLNLDDYFLNDIVVKTNKDYIRADKLKGSIEVDFNIRKAESSPLHFLITMIINVNKDEASFRKSNYKVSLNIDGFFSFSEGTDEDIVKKMIAPNGLSILYGVARGITAQVTANGKHGKLVLPALNFIKIIKKKAESLSKSYKKPMSKTHKEQFQTVGSN